MTEAEKFMGRLRAELATAMREGVNIRVRAIRSLMSAIANAESMQSADQDVDAPIGAFKGDITRRNLSMEEITEVVRAEIDEHESAIESYRALGREAEADVLGEELVTLRQYLD